MPEMLIIDVLHPLVIVRKIDITPATPPRFTPNADIDAAFDEGARWTDDGAIEFTATFAGSAVIDHALDNGARWAADGAIEFA